MYRDANGEKQKVVATTRIMTVKWNNGKGNYQYWVNTLDEIENGERHITDSAYGDKDWATRMADHYDLTIPEAKD